MMKLTRELEKGCAPIEFEAFFPHELLSSQESPSCATPRAEEALASLNTPRPSTSRAASRAEALVALQHPQSSSQQQSPPVADAELNVRALPEICQTQSYTPKSPPTAPKINALAPSEVPNVTTGIRSNCKYYHNCVFLRDICYILRNHVHNPCFMFQVAARSSNWKCCES